MDATARAQSFTFSEAVLYGLVFFVFVALCMHLPVAIYANASLDDALFIKNSQHLASFHWLGPFNQTTLAKGTFFPIFLALNSYLGVPVTLSIALFYALAVWLFVRALLLHGLSRWGAWLVFVVVLFQPAIFPTRIIRDYIYHSLALLVLAGILSIWSQTQVQRRFNPNTFLFGLAWGAFWLTREEGVWILPGVAVFLAYQFFSLRNSRLQMWALARGIFVYLLGALVLPVCVASLNWLNYGAFQTVDFKSRNFEAALNRLNSVSIEREVPYVPVPAEKRALIYKVSPSFRKLEDYLEVRGRAWMQPGCAHYPMTCGDYAGGWFMWALRDAVADAGFYRQPGAADQFFASLASEIDIACREGALACKESVLPFLPQIPAQNLSKIPAAVKEALALSLYWTPISLSDGESWGSGGVLNDMGLFLGNPKRTPTLAEQVSTFSGWYYGADGEWLESICDRSGQTVVVAIERLNSPDIAAHVGDSTATQQRFGMSFKDSENCKIVASKSKNEVLSASDALRLPSASVQLGSGSIHFDHRSSGTKSFEAALQVKKLLAKVFQWIGAPLIGLSLICYLGTLIFSIVYKQYRSPLLCIASMLWILYGVRVVLVVLIDISSFPAVNYLYLTPVFPMLYSAAILSVLLVLELTQKVTRAAVVRT